jgi:hypothetical protein
VERQAERDAARSDAPNADIGNIRETMREVTNASFTKGGFDDIVERFAQADRERFNKDKFTEEKHEVLDGRIAQLQKDWKAKYNTDFDLKTAGLVFGPEFAMISSPPAAVTAGQRQGPADEAQRADDARRNDDAAARDRRPDTGDSVKTSDATVVIKESHNMPEATLNMRKEAMGRWKIDVADTYTAKQFHDNLLKHLTMFNEQKDSWPASETEAYKMASHHVLLAVSNIDGKSMNMRQPEMQPGENRPGETPARDRQDTAPFPRPSETPAPRP